MHKFSTRLDMPAIPKILRTHVTARLHVSLFILFFCKENEKYQNEMLPLLIAIDWPDLH